MNLLFVFLKHLEEPMKAKLRSITPRGTTGAVWALINEQTASGEFDKKQITQATGISTSHLDKISSELLARCYQILFESDATKLLDYLSRQMVYVRLFYSELSRQLKSLSGMGDTEQQALFIRQCFRMIHTNLPMVTREPDMSERMAAKYVSLFKGVAKKEAVFYTKCKLLFEEMERLFAASAIKEKVDILEAEFTALGKPESGFSAETVFDYLWIRIYFYHAQENFAAALDVAQAALLTLAPYKGEKNKVNMLRLHFKVSEFLYFLSRFDEAYEGYVKALNSPLIDKVHDRPYHVNKFIQLCLITGHIAEAGTILNHKLKQMDGKVGLTIITRDVITYIKYYLFNREYDRAFEFLQMGFEKNPKGKYFQYEIELRNLQTACFFLSGSKEVVADMCRKHIKFLRNHDYTATNSDYPHFYILAKAMCEKPHSPFSARHQKMFDRYQRGSFAVYGRLLQLMKKAK